MIKQIDDFAQTSKIRGRLRFTSWNPRSTAEFQDESFTFFSQALTKAGPYHILWPQIGGAKLQEFIKAHHLVIPDELKEDFADYYSFPELRFYDLSTNSQALSIAYDNGIGPESRNFRLVQKDQHKEIAEWSPWLSAYDVKYPADAVVVSQNGEDYILINQPYLEKGKYESERRFPEGYIAYVINLFKLGKSEEEAECQFSVLFLQDKKQLDPESGSYQKARLEAPLPDE